MNASPLHDAHRFGSGQAGLATRVVAGAVWVSSVSLLVACAGGSPSPAVNATPPATQTPLTQVAKFAPDRLARLRQSLEPQQWSHLGQFVRRSGSSGEGIEFAHFVDAASLVRSGSTVRYRALSVYAKPVGPMASNIVYAVADCSKRTLQSVASDSYSDEAASVRVSSANVPGPVAVVQPQTQGEVTWSAVCVGRLASAVPGGAPLPAPAAAAAPSAASAPAPKDSSGSGVAIAPRLTLTNAHVVSRCRTIHVVAAGQRWPASVRKRDAANDLALLDVADLPAMPYPAWRRQALIGEPVMAAGYPLAGLLSTDVIVTDGIVNALAGLRNSTSHLQVSAAIQRGNSGGPLLDRGGNVVGIVVSKLNAMALAAVTGDVAQNVNFAIKPEVVDQFLQSENLPLRRAEAAGHLDTQQVAAKAREFTVKVECRV